MQKSDLIDLLLKNRGLTDPDAIRTFFHPPDPFDIPCSKLGWDSSLLTPALKLVKSHLSALTPIAVYGDYDVDGITSTAILWEALHLFSPAVFPHIPHRRAEGYGLTKKGIDHCLSAGAKLIITADNGITAAEEITYCKDQGCDIIVIDHHTPPEHPPRPDFLLYSSATSAAGLSWFFSRELLTAFSPDNQLLSDLLSLAAVSVICDLVPLLGISRSIAKFGLKNLNTTRRPGLVSLFNVAGLTPGRIGTYEVGFVIGPRINAMGRLEHALDSLRLLCTKNLTRASELARLLDDTNRNRQDLTLSSTQKALSVFSDASPPAVILSADSSYDEGVIGLVAAKLVERFYRPALVISVGPEICKGSARSIPGFNITDFLRQHQTLLSSVGGHAMAAGFSLPTFDLEAFTSQINTAAASVDTSLFIRERRVDADIPLDIIDWDLYKKLDQFAPFGLGNPRPVFSATNVTVSSPKRIGKDFSHLKFVASGFDSIYFQAPPDLTLPSHLSKIVFSIDVNTYNGNSRLQLLIKDVYASAPD